jgi:DNA-binding MarR family transcriptional regulator
MEGQSNARDHIDRVIEQWAEARPDLDMGPLEILGRVARVSGLFRAASRPVIARYGIDNNEWALLVALYRTRQAGGITPTALAKSLLVTSGGVTRLIVRLRSRGLIKRHQDPRDKRRAVLELTPRGEKLVEEAFTAQNQLDHELVAVLSPSEREQLTALLRKLLLSLDDGSFTAARPSKQDNGREPSGSGADEANRRGAGGDRAHRAARRPAR